MQAEAAARGPVYSREVLDRVGGALWGLFIADALAMPTHWFYGGSRQVKQMYGGPIKGYVAPIKDYPGSIMNLSSTGGGGRGGDGGDIVGKVINHGKKQYWTRQGQYFYHCTLAKAENTLEASLVRLVCESISENSGTFKPEEMRKKYMDFMQTPGSHNDCYASTCHRMFFANLKRGVPPEKCPDNDGHNVDTIDGLILGLPVGLATLELPFEEAAKSIRSCTAVTRNTTVLASYEGHLLTILRDVLAGTPIRKALETNAGRQLEDVVRSASQREGRIPCWFGCSDELHVQYCAEKSQMIRDPVVACYISSNYPSMIHFASKYADNFEGGLLANSNCGGENVHRGCVLGALLGAHVGESQIPEHLKEELHDAALIRKQIEAFKSNLGRPTSTM